VKSLESSAVSNHVDKKKKKRKIKKKTNKLGEKLPTIAGHVGSNQPAIVHHVGSVDNVNKSTKTHRKLKFPCMICKGDHLIKDCTGNSKVVEVWSEVSQPTASHVGDKPSNIYNQVGSKKGKVKFPCLLCKEMHHSYPSLCTDEASYLLKKIVDV
jgi:hypothetical protein